jgi:hypothetical protein
MTRPSHERFDMEYLLLILAVAVPFVGYNVTRMENIDTGMRLPVRDGIYYGVGKGLGYFGLLSFMFWFVVWMWSLYLDQPVMIIDMSFWLFCSIGSIGVGGLVMACTRPRHLLD